MNESTRKPYITVFTPTYNRAYTLQRLYESLRKQTQHDFEWLIVDDGSTDNTESLVQEFIRENSLFNIRYVKKENEGNILQSMLAQRLQWVNSFLSLIQMMR